MRFPLIAVVLLAPALLFLQGSARAADKPEKPLGVRSTMPKSIGTLQGQLARLALRLEKVVEEARRDEAELKIAIYLKYPPKELKKTRGRVRAEDLLAWMVDKTKNPETVRKPALEALIKGAQLRGDPDLSNDEKRGPYTKRAYFCWREAAPYLKDDKIDRLGRDFVRQFLEKLYPQAERQNPEIRIYHADREPTWGAAYSAWVRFLKKQ